MSIFFLPRDASQIHQEQAETAVLGEEMKAQLAEESFLPDDSFM
jgi:hypothetical protein